MSTEADFVAQLTPLIGNLRGFARNLTHDVYAADDLVQIAAVKAFQNFSRFTPGTNFSSWIHKILINAHRDALRKSIRRGRREVSLENALPDGIEASLNARSRADFEAVDESDRLYHALAKLPHEFREAFIGTEVEGYSLDELAARLGIPSGTVKSRKHRAIRMLQEALTQGAASEGSAQHGIDSPDLNDGNQPVSEFAL